MEFIHEDYSGWNNVESIPADKQSLVTELNFEIPIKRMEDYSIIPVKLNIHGEIAVVHYYLKNKSENNKNLLSNDARYYTDVLIKNNCRWLLFADHFGIQESRNYFFKNKSE